MKKLIVLIFILAVFTAKTQEIYESYLDQITLCENETNSRDDKILCDSIYGYEWTFQSWNHNGRDYYLYNQNGSKSEFFSTSLHESNEWYTDRKLTYVYNYMGLLVEFMDQRGNPDISEIENYTHHYHTFNDQGLLVVDSILLWETDSSVWNPKWKESQKYNSFNDLEYILSWIWNSEYELWDTGFQSNYTYFEDGNLKNYAKQKWDDANSTWKNYRRFSYTYYENEKLKDYKWEYWNDEVEEWNNQILFTYTYDSNGYLIERLRRGWDNTLEEWYPYYRYIYSNNIEGFVEERLTQYWDIQDSIWLNNYNEFYYYSTHQTSKINKHETGNNVILFPNPARNVVNIINNSSAKYEINICDMFGHIYETEMLLSEFGRLDLSNFKNGTYLLNFYTGGTKQFTKKIVIE